MDRLLLTFVLKLCKCILLKNAVSQLKAWKKYLLLKRETLEKRQLACYICSFCLIVAYRLKSVLLFISVGQTSFFLFELYVDRSYMKVKFMHNLLKLALIYHLKWANNLSQVFIFSEKKVRPTDPSDRITQMKNFNWIIIVRKVCKYF